MPFITQQSADAETRQLPIIDMTPVCGKSHLLSITSSSTSFTTSHHHHATIFNDKTMAPTAFNQAWNAHENPPQ